MTYPLGENLEVVGDRESRWVRCTRCDHKLSRSPTAWREAARTRIVPATAAGPLMAILEAQYRLEQLLCPSCGALFDTQLVEQGPGHPG